MGQPFGVPVAADAVAADRDLLVLLAADRARDGAFPVSAWGPGREWLHDRVDDAGLMADPEGPGLSPGTVATTGLDGESAAEAAEAAGWVPGSAAACGNQRSLLSAT